MTETSNFTVVMTPHMKDLASQFDNPPEKPKFIPKPEEVQELIELSLIYPVTEIPAHSKYLFRYTKHQIQEIYKSILNGEIEIPKSKSKINKKEFSLEEDFIILTFIRLQPGSNISNLIEMYGELFPIYRKNSEIKKRYNELKKLPNDKVSEILDKYTREIAYEDLFGTSTQKASEDSTIKDIKFIQCRCNYQPVIYDQLSSKASDELDRLDKISEIYWQREFSPNDLAILRSEKLKFFMRREAIMIGRGTLDFDVDVNLSEFGERACVHVSRNQAVISFLLDFNFYITNIGNRTFRVNGVVIGPGKKCRLHDEYLLDFSGILLIFYSNRQLIDQIKVALDDSMENQNKREAN
ncbi:hypothetical protein TVAG_428640 [Trichomonas vaginalis G3]|uniref:FHA domain-containing protein n=1 Tax=Trichomonas vaginalis (strain ATCC PRA-98 / G3) TaxID=412133 RepID=A2FJ54_TRIV3|nr:G-quadruplex RNA binding [Trichomonas vaginalis G3]EAX95061.1 hypothetical protein TVAG_428640 [Trichomonas vaginalis G3]KAI5484697.1 G-quadruplex RNA binding [Trichomonas vaginalis G3]|eukprot:XP_001307991.1 hypothetical protein [Trichomonas vaginalis G3]